MYFGLVGRSMILRKHCMNKLETDYKCDRRGPEMAIPTWKRCLDLSLIILGFPVWAPAFVAIGIWVWASSNGPILYRQERAGQCRKKFQMIKFRSMVANADQGQHDKHVLELIESGKPLTKLDTIGDTRLIPLGGLLRSSGLDELPQILNVIRGEMSLVGPRPCTVTEENRYRREQFERFNSPPGVTGFWQVNGKNRTTFNEMNAMDIYYTRNMSLGLDLRIIARTPVAIFAQLYHWRHSRAVARTAPLDPPISSLPEESGVRWR
ncbi:MAG: sugar transferase [Verrucomicrobiales bacterium]